MSTAHWDYRAYCPNCKRFIRERRAEKCDRCGDQTVQRPAACYIPPDATDEELARMQKEYQDAE